MLHHLYTVWQRRDRPVGVTLAALGTALMGMIMLAIAALIVSRLGATGLNIGLQVLILALLLALSVALFGISYGLLQLNPRAHQITVVLLGLGFASQVIEMIQQNRFHPGELGGVVALIYLLLPSVRRAFTTHEEK